MSRKGKGAGCESWPQGQSPEVGILWHSWGGWFCVQPPQLQSLAFLPIPCVWFLKGATADLLDSGLHTMNETAEVHILPYDIRKSSFILHTQGMEARNCTFMNLLTEKQFLLKELELACWHLPQKPLHLLISKKQNQIKTNPLQCPGFRKKWT